MATPNRPLIVGPDSGLEPPYPLRMSGRVISGFGRGSKELGIPTANLPVDEARTPWIATAASGVYFGWAALRLPPTHPDYDPSAASPPASSSSSSSSSSSTTARAGQQGKDDDQPTDAGATAASGRHGFAVYPMVMSIGYNPFYKNTVRSAEVHVLRRFGADFYGAEMRLLITGFIREERDYAGLEALIADINFDCDVARRSLARPAWAPREVEVEVEVGKGSGNDGEEGTREEKKRLRGTLDCGWLIRPSEEEVVQEESKEK